MKTTAWERYSADSELHKKFLNLSGRIRNNIMAGHENHIDFLKRFKSHVGNLGIQVRFIGECEMNKFSPGKNDIVISFGGDGTFLSCAQHYPDSLLLGINSDYRGKEEGSYGALTTLTKENFIEGLHAVLNSDFEISEWPKLGAMLNGKLIEKTAVNDIFVGNRIAFESCDISIEQENDAEDFLCSGVLLSTGMGSHAWYKAAGGTPFGNELNAYGFIVIMPSNKKIPKFSSGMVGSNSNIIIKPNRDDYIIAFDSKKDTLSLTVGDIVEVTMSDIQPLRVMIPNL